jgi:hypothetical protein
VLSDHLLVQAVCADGHVPADVQVLVRKSEHAPQIYKSSKVISLSVLRLAAQPVAKCE